LRSTRRRFAFGAFSAAAIAAAWSLFESQWVERRELDMRIPGLPPELDGFRVLHLSDLHLGTLSLGGRALDAAVAWAAEARPDLIAITGDLVTRRGGKRKLEEALSRLQAPNGVYAVLGNHDVDNARDPFTRPTDLSDLQAAGAVLLRDDARTAGLVQVVGVDPDSYRTRTSRPAERIEEDAGVRILLCHFPEVVCGLPAGAFHLVLAGHYHGGQIVLPTPWGKVHLKELRSRYRDGLFETPAGLLHVSRGLGTAFVPFRLFARPEATLLTLRTSD
jgi:predicted MPP superfamily phosphohydrolase